MFRFPPLTLLVRTCLVTFLVAYVALLVGVNWLGQEHLLHYLALSSGELWIGNVWQLATYVIVQDPSPQGVVGFLVSAIFFWWMVVPYEQSFGTKRAVQLLIACLFGGSIPALLVGIIAPGVLFGLGPLIVGVISASAWTSRTLGHQSIDLFGVWKMKPITLIWLVLGFSGLHFLASRSFMDLASDIGAVIAGILFTEWMSRPPAGKRTRKKSGGRRRGPALQVIDGGKDDDPPKWLN